MTGREPDDGLPDDGRSEVGLPDDGRSEVGRSGVGLVLDGDRVARVLAELDELQAEFPDPGPDPGPGSDPELAAVRTAILLEDALGITLPDDALRAETLGDRSALGGLPRTGLRTGPRPEPRPRPAHPDGGAG